MRIFPPTSEDNHHDQISFWDQNHDWLSAEPVVKILNIRGAPWRGGFLSLCGTFWLLAKKVEIMFAVLVAFWGKIFRVWDGVLLLHLWHLLGSKYHLIISKKVEKMLDIIGAFWKNKIDFLGEGGHRVYPKALNGGIHHHYMVIS